MNKALIPSKHKVLPGFWKRILVFFSIFGPATITAMADNDASGVATYAVAGAKLGYPILFLLLIVTILLGITQEMGIRLTIVTRRGLADLIRERHGVTASMFMFLALFIANMGILVVDAAAVEVMAEIFHIPACSDCDSGLRNRLFCDRKGELQIHPVFHADSLPVLPRLHCLGG